MLSEQAKQKIQALRAKYPHARSAVMPALYVAQEEYGWLSQEAIDAVAGEMGMTSTEVNSVASFYTMYHVRPVGDVVVAQALSNAAITMVAMSGFTAVPLGSWAQCAAIRLNFPSIRRRTTACRT